MLPIEFKEKILDGTMCAFVSKNIEVNVGNKFYFLEYLEWNRELQKHFPKIFISLDDSYPEFIAKAECLGLVKSKLYFYAGEVFCKDIFFDEFETVPKKTFGFNDFEKCREYYKKLLGDTLEGYLHIFKLVEGGGGNGI